MPRSPRLESSRDAMRAPSVRVRSGDKSQGRQIPWTRWISAVEDEDESGDMNIVGGKTEINTLATHFDINLVPFYGLPFILPD